MALFANASRRNLLPATRRAFSTGATFPPIKTGRPDVGELSRGQNKVREIAANEYMDNVTPTWQKGKSDGMVNIVGNLIQGFGFLLIARNIYDLSTDSHKIEGK